MTQPTATPETWSPQKWVLVILFLVGVQVVLLKLFSVEVAGKATEDFDDSPSLVMVSVLPEDALNYVSLKDPTLFILPNQQGVSGQSWLRAVTFTNSSTQWQPTDQWLAPSRFESSTNNPSDQWQNAAFQVSLVEKIEPAEASPSYKSSERESSVSLGQNSGKREIKSHPELPEFDVPGLVSPTTVEIFVNESGQVVSAPVIEPSDHSEANVAATQLANNFRFRPTPEEFDGTRAKHVDSLNVTFHWKTKKPETPATEATQP